QDLPLALGSRPAERERSGEAAALKMGAGGKVRNTAQVQESEPSHRQHNDGNAVPDLGRAWPPKPDAASTIPVWQLLDEHEKDGSGDEAGQRTQLRGSPQSCTPEAFGEPRHESKRWRSLKGREDERERTRHVAPAGAWLGPAARQ